MRALRADKLTYAALDATLALWQQAPARDQIPVFRMLTMTRDEIAGRADALVAALKKTPGVITDVIGGFSTVGGGSAPGSALPTALVAIVTKGLSAAALESRLREGHPPLIARIEDDQVLIDLRTVSPDDDASLTATVAAAVSRKP